jgi:hypothetical protein
MVVGPFAHKGSEYCHYVLMLSCSIVIIQAARPEISDAHVKNAATSMSFAVVDLKPADHSALE